MVFREAYNALQESIWMVVNTAVTRLEVSRGVKFARFSYTCCCMHMLSCFVYIAMQNVGEHPLNFFVVFRSRICT